MPDVGVITEQGFNVDSAGLGFKPVKEDGYNPFDNKKDTKPETTKDKDR